MNEEEANRIFYNCSPSPPRTMKSPSPLQVSAYSVSQNMVKSCRNCKFSFRTEFKPNAEYCTKDCETSHCWFTKKTCAQPTSLFNDCQDPFVKPTIVVQANNVVVTAPSTASTTPVPNIIFEDNYILDTNALSIKYDPMNTGNTDSTKAFSVDSSSDDGCAMDLCLEFQLPSENTNKKHAHVQKTAKRHKPSNFVRGVKSAFKKLLNV